ncbi:hypothetical protein DYB36_010895 [Aphanomyces astaci]|uniref:Uncharacterized protein n=1 Tax=Aphanomyces astaci TaxID=112090 RepID=A0A396ZPP0_APHAT|nr:hypothetical protein DYB36_010895 [Aphanomyces astaci]
MTMTNFSPSEFNLIWTELYKGSVTDKTIFDENIDYQGIQHNVRAVLPLKKPVGGILIFAEQTKNDRIASDRLIIEDYFSRLKTLWATCSDTYRWSRKSYDIVFQTSLALTNVHVRLHPLRAEDGDTNV